MADSGWDIAMRRIDAEFDLAQFVASALVRKIAASNFRLPASDRVKVGYLPDEVIARIQHIVLESYLEAGEDIDEDILREDLWQQALTSRREMIANGELISEAEFRRRGNLTARRLSVLLADDSVFTIKVDGVEYFPALLAVPASQRRSIYAICQIIAPAPSDARLDFLTSRRERLGDRSPLEVLKSVDGFKTVSRMATAWATQWSRTVVKIFDGEHEVEPADIELLYTAAADVDPRRPLWERASNALHLHGYQWPLGPYPDVRIFSLFVARQAAGDSTPIREACVQIHVDGERILIRIAAAVGTRLHSETLPRDEHESFIEIAKRIVGYLCKHL
ncbi:MULTISPECIES: hypothetical protein [Paraburkholderia]|uniref:Uncharacterized protein n=1 Tax=Paraburkholderia dioscoreae TaxID=2604047 RepID=A0A5Q4Z1R7_9BURK|nr:MULTISPECIES: hypothetical protein [Paraburkholderia]MDR8397128.1 hypothetical protein [Paraburkholderia sp. USG1]VVD27482.1 conserved protein of unknown function [Paraburkholderia dioscoreae]